jgi:dienelactone hydrolase
MVKFTRERTDDGVTERLFDLTVSGERVPAVLWSPEGAKEPRPLICMGHGGSQHKKVGSLTDRARRYAQRFGYATLALDAPGHGDRISREEAEALAKDIADRAAGRGTRGGPFTELMRSMNQRARQAIPEWSAAIDAVETLDFVGKAGIGYWGISMGSTIGIPFVAAEPRVKCAVFGLAGLRESEQAFGEAARAIAIPIEFVFQWDDAVAPRDGGIALFNAFASKEKTMHANPGAHGQIPAFETESWERFFIRHLGMAADVALARAA